jgi:hypothetical protein
MGAGYAGSGRGRGGYTPNRDDPADATVSAPPGLRLHAASRPSLRPLGEAEHGSTARLVDFIAALGGRDVP